MTALARLSSVIGVDFTIATQQRIIIHADYYCARGQKAMLIGRLSRRSMPIRGLPARQRPFASTMTPMMPPFASGRHARPADDIARRRFRRFAHLSPKSHSM